MPVLNELTSPSSRWARPRAVAVLGGLLLFTAVACTGCSSDETPSECPTPTASAAGKSAYSQADLQGVNAEDCNLVGKEIQVGQLSVVIPSPGNSVTAHGDAGTDGESTTYTVSTSDSGVISIST